MKINKKSYAVCETDSLGRLYEEDSRKDVRGLYARDRDRILHSTGFRRLKGKTQVFMSTNEDHHRTRLTHSLEVSQIARTIARTLELNEDLTETIALAHDLGHTPYGHIGEDSLDECMMVYGGFDHNAQSLRIVTKLEQRYPQFDGLNLTWESLEGIVKHNGPIEKPYPFCIDEFNNKYDLKLSSYASLEAQVAAIADDVAYNHHDIDDGWRAGLFTLNDLYEIEHIGNTIEQVKNEYSGISQERLMFETLRRTMSSMILDIVENTENNLNRIKPETVNDIRNCGQQIVDMSPDMLAKNKQTREFLFKNVYRAGVVNAKRDDCYKHIDVLFSAYMNDEKLLPNGWQQKTQDYTDKDSAKARGVADYIAGMTDRYADDRYNDIVNK